MSTNNVSDAVFNFISENPGANGREILNNLISSGYGLSQSSLSRLMLSLVEDGVIVKKGHAKGTQYYLDSLSSLLNTDPKSRPPVPYSYNFIDSLDTQSSLFSSSELDKLSNVGRISDNGQLSTLSIQHFYHFILDVSYSSSKMEGNKYTYLETEVLLQYGESAKGRSPTDTQMIVNHKHALEYLLENMDVVNIDEKTIKDVHSHLSYNLPGVTVKEQGAYRDRMVTMNGSAFKPLTIPQQIPTEMVKILRKINQMPTVFDKAVGILGLIPYLQPFVDVNKRVGRLMCNVPLIQAGFAPMSFKSMSKLDYTRGMIAVYELNQLSTLKNAFMDAYLEASPELVSDLSQAQSQKNNDLAMRYGSLIRGEVAQYFRSGGEHDFMACLEKIDDDAERNALAGIIKSTIENMHEGAISSYGITSEDFEKVNAKAQSKHRHS